MTAAAFDNILARRLNTFVALSRKELKVLGELQKNPFRAQRGQLLLQEGQPDPKVFILQTGWGYGYKVLPMAAGRSSPWPWRGTWLVCAACSCERLIILSRC